MAENVDLAVLGVVLDPSGVVTGVKVSEQQLGRLRNAVGKTETSFGTMAKRASGALVALVGIGKLGQEFGRGIRAMRDMETGLIGVQKTANLSNKEVSLMRAEMLKLEQFRPEGVEQLLEVAEAAGQMGVSGIPAIMQFTSVMADLAVASDVSGEAGARSIKRILDTTGDLTGDGVMRIDRFASALVGLGNDAAATEQEILTTASELARSLAQFNIADFDILGFSTALTETGQKPALAGSALGRLGRRLADVEAAGSKGAVTLKKLGDTIGGIDIEKLFSQDASAGLDAFLQALGKVEGNDIAKVMRDLKLDGEEMNKVIPVLALNWDKLGGRLEMSKRLYMENTAATEESIRAQSTLSSRIAMLGNNWKQFMRTLAESKEGPINDLINGLNVGLQLINQGQEGGMSQIAKSLGFAALEFVSTMANGIVKLGLLIRDTIIASLIFGFKTAFSWVSENAADFFSGLIDSLIEGAKGIGKAIKDGFFGGGDEGGESAIGDNIQKRIKGLGEAFAGDSFQNIFDSIRDSGGGEFEEWLLSKVQGGLDTLREGLRESTAENQRRANENNLGKNQSAQVGAVDGLNMAGMEVTITKWEEFKGNFGVGWNDAAEEFGDAMTLVQDMGRMTFETLDQGFSGLMDDFVDDLKLSKEEIGNFFGWLGKQMLKMVLMQTIIRPLMGSIGLDNFGQGIELHEGGIVGKEGKPRRFHSGTGVKGLTSNEVPAILQKGEGVFTKEQMANMAPSGGGSINMPITIGVNITQESGGKEGDDDLQKNQKMGEMLGATLSQKIQQEVGRMLLPGGMIFRAARPNG